MIFLGKEEYSAVMSHPLMEAAEAVAIGLSLRAEERWSTEGVAAAQRANEAAYWLAKDLANEALAQMAKEIVRGARDEGP